MGVPYALAVSSCSSALFLSLKALDLPPGGRVLVPAFTFAAVPSAVVHAGGVPVLVEVGESFRIDLADFEAKLAAGAEAVLVSHMRGHTSDMDAIMALTEARGVPVIEDAAHSLGTLWGGRKIGTIGRIGCFSFQSYKLMNAGEGGMLVTEDPDLIARAIVMSGRLRAQLEEARAGAGALPLLAEPAAALQPADEQPLGGGAAARRSTRCRAGPATGGRTTTGWRPRSTPRPGSRCRRRSTASCGRRIRSSSTSAASTSTTRPVPSSARPRRGASRCRCSGSPSSNARAFWNWGFLGPQPDLPRTRAMLMRACDVRLPARLGRDELDFIAGGLVAAAEAVKGDA